MTFLTACSRIIVLGTLAGAWCSAEVCAEDTQGDVSQRVAEAFEAFRRGDHAPLDELRKQASSVIPHLQRYVTATEPEIRSELVEFARGQATEAAARLLVALVRDGDRYVSEKAIGSLYADFTCAALRKFGDLKCNLIEILRERPNTAKAILLLSCYKEDADTATFLSKLRSRSDDLLTKIENGSRVVKVGLCIDVALGACGVEDASRRLQGAVEEGEVANLVFLLETVRFIEEQALLRRLAGLLKDTRDALPGAPSGTGYYLRVCDIAVRALVPRLGLDVGFDASASRRFTDEELRLVAERLAAVLSKAEDRK